jgi:hypothetical protein
VYSYKARFEGSRLDKSTSVIGKRVPRKTSHFRSKEVASPNGGNTRLCACECLLVIFQIEILDNVSSLSFQCLVFARCIALSHVSSSLLKIDLLLTEGSCRKHFLGRFTFVESHPRGGWATRPPPAVLCQTSQD